MTTRNLFSLKRTIFSLLFSFILLFSAVPIGAQAEEPARLHLVATVFPAYDFARVVAGDAAEVTLLLPPGADAHSYEPTPQDMIAIQNADLFLYTGGESDSWLERVLDSLGDDAPETLYSERGTQLRKTSPAGNAILPTAQPEDGYTI